MGKFGSLAAAAGLSAAIAGTDACDVEQNYDGVGAYSEGGNSANGEWQCPTPIELYVSIADENSGELLGADGETLDSFAGSQLISGICEELHGQAFVLVLNDPAAILKANYVETGEPAELIFGQGTKAAEYEVGDTGAEVEAEKAVIEVQVP